MLLTASFISASPAGRGFPSSFERKSLLRSQISFAGEAPVEVPSPVEVPLAIPCLGRLGAQRICINQQGMGQIKCLTCSRFHQA